MFNKRIIIAVLLVFGFLFTITTFVDAAKKYIPSEVAKKFLSEEAGGTGEFDANFLKFLNWLFPAMLAVVTILAVLVLIFAGFKWMTGAISPPQVEDAKKWIWAAIIGLSLALLSFLILKTINPDLISLKEPEGLEEPQ